MNICGLPRKEYSEAVVIIATPPHRPHMAMVRKVKCATPAASMLAGWMSPRLIISGARIR